MRKTRSSTQVSVVKNRTVLSSGMENIPPLNQKKTKEFCRMNLRKRNPENNFKEISQTNPDSPIKENINKLKVNNVKKFKRNSQVVDKENINLKNKANNRQKTQNISLITPNKENVKESFNCPILKTYPIWKSQLNDQMSLLQKTKRKKIDVYDIAEDEDLKSELSSKLKKKQTKCNTKVIKQKKKLCKVSKIKGSMLDTKKNCSLSIIKENTSEKSVLINNNISNADQSKLKEQNISYLNLKNQIDGYVSCAEKLNEINSNDQINSIADPLSYKTMHNLPKSVQESKTLLSKKNIHVKVDDSIKCPDLSDQVIHEKTPTKEMEAKSSHECTSDDLNNYEAFSLLPKMTSTPESDTHPCTAPIRAFHLKSFETRMSEIPTIPGQYTDVVEIASAEELLNIVNPSVTSVEISLFESPPKLECDKQIGLSEYRPKQLQMNLNAQNTYPPYSNETGNGFEAGNELETLFPFEHSIIHSDSNMNEENMLLFDSPEKLKCQKKANKGKKDETDLFHIKVNKPRKSYDNREKSKKLLLRNRGRCVKKKTAAMKKEETLIHSLNEHFKELESFEFCIE